MPVVPVSVKRSRRTQQDLQDRREIIRQRLEGRTKTKKK